MKGIIIQYNNKSQNINIEGVFLYIHIDHIVNRDTFICVNSTEYGTQERKVWHEFTPINIGDIFEIKITDILTVTPPIKRVHDSNIVHPMSKLEEFYKLESLLKEKGLL